MNIKTGDNVKVLSGKDRGKIGKVVQVLFNKRKAMGYAVVDGVNVLKKHMKAGRGKKGQVIELPSPIHASKLMIIDPKSNKPTRIGKKVEGDTKKRVSKKSGEFID